MKNLKVVNCKRCGKEITTMKRPIHSSNEIMKKYQGICQSCMTEKEYNTMMLEMNREITKRCI